MADTGKQSPQGANILGSLLLNQGIGLNLPTKALVGESKLVANYSFGTIVQNSHLRIITWAINQTDGLNAQTYNNLINIGYNSIRALGNSKSDKYAWTGNPTWAPDWKAFSAITRWGYIRLFALQAWDEFNYNNTLVSASGEIRDFLSSFMTAAGFIDYSNPNILTLFNSQKFLEGTYSNMDNLITADITGVSLATVPFGQDLITSGKAIDLSSISTFGLPSNLLTTLQQNNGLTKSVNLALQASGISSSNLTEILAKTTPVTAAQQINIYNSFKIIVATDLVEVLTALNCKTAGITSLADLLDPKKLFPVSYRSLTVPVYNLTTTPTNSKTAYPIYISTGVNPVLNAPAIKAQIGTQVVPGAPVVVEPEPVQTATTAQTQTVTSITGTPTFVVGGTAATLGSATPGNVSVAVFGGTTTATTVTTAPPTLQEPKTGFGSYIQGIIPDDIATAAGAFSIAMQQIRNISEVQIEKFAQVVGNMETTAGLPAVNGTTVPVNKPLIQGGLAKVALGSGPNGIFTMSDFFGCMSGLPYDWKGIQSLILELQTAKLKSIYRELYLAATWAGATASVEHTTWSVQTQTFVAEVPGVPAVPPATGWITPPIPEIPALYDWYVACTKSKFDGGRGYGRGGAPVPSVAVVTSSGQNPMGVSAGMIKIGTDDAAIPTSFGSITDYYIGLGGAYMYKGGDLNKNNPGPGSGYEGFLPKIQIQAPPTSYPGGSNTPHGTIGWPQPMSNTLQRHIDDANAEIIKIKQNNVSKSNQLNTLWDGTGTQLTIEQRARTLALNINASPATNPTADLSRFPTAQYGFVDSMPRFSANTYPHMYAQTIEAITLGSQAPIPAPAPSPAPAPASPAAAFVIGGTTVATTSTTTATAPAPAPAAAAPSPAVASASASAQSVAANMRETRNQSRLVKAGITLDNNIDDGLSPVEAAAWIANGTLPTTVIPPIILPATPAPGPGSGPGPGPSPASSPTEYATWGITIISAYGSLANGNLTASLGPGAFNTNTTGGSNIYAISTVDISSGSWYWEITNNTISTVQGSFAGIANAGTPPTAYTRVYANGLVLDPANITLGNIGTWTTIGFLLNGATLTIYKDGVLALAVEHKLTGKIYPIVSANGVSQISRVAFTANFGKSTFVNAVPTGANPGLYIPGYPASSNTNSLAVWNKDAKSASATLSNGDLSVFLPTTMASGAAQAYAKSNLGVNANSGPWYFEAKFTGPGGGWIGLCTSDWVPTGAVYVPGTIQVYTGSGLIVNNGLFNGNPTSFTSQVTIGFLIDGDYITIYRNGSVYLTRVLHNLYPPSAPVPVYAVAVGNVYNPFVTSGSRDTTFNVNFGQNTFSSLPAGSKSGFYTPAYSNLPAPAPLVMNLPSGQLSGTNASFIARMSNNVFYNNLNFKFTMKSNGYFSKNFPGAGSGSPGSSTGAHIAVVSRAYTPTPLNTVRGQGIIIGDVSISPIPDPRESVTPRIPSIQFESWQHNLPPQDHYLFVGNTDTPYFSDNVEYIIAINSNVSTDKKVRTVRTTVTVGTTVIYDSGITNDPNEQFNPDCNGVFFGQVFQYVSTGWTVDFTNLTLTAYNN